MNLRQITFILTLSLAVSICASAQEQTAKPASSPTPAKRSFDQFDLPGGIQIASAPQTNTTNIIPTTVAAEPLDRNTYSGVIMMIDYGASIERDYRTSYSQNIDPSNFFAPDNMLRRKLPAMYRTIEIYKSGLLFGERLKSNENIALLKDNQSIIEDMMAVLVLMPNDQGQRTGRLKSISERYLLTSPPEMEMVEKNTLLLAMFSKLNGNFRRLRQQIVAAN